MPPAAQWLVIADYPRNPSPYFGAMNRAAADVGLPIAFSPELPAPGTAAGIINLHRLKRLYRGAGGERTHEALDRFLAGLDAQRASGMRIVWTVQNIYPIDGTAAAQDTDVRATTEVLKRVDAVLCHTESDAANFRRMVPPTARVVVSGWGGLPSGETLGPDTAALLERIPGDRPVFLVLGNDAPYKELRRVCETFLESTTRGRLVVAGPMKGTADDLRSRSGERLLFWNQRVEPSEAHYLLGRAAWSVCHYASQGRYAYFRDFIYPSSISVAVCTGVPLIAPDLPAIRELSAGHPRILYVDESDGMARAFAEADSREAPGHAVVPPIEPTWERWRGVTRSYLEVFEELCGSP